MSTSTATVAQMKALKELIDAGANPFCFCNAGQTDPKKMVIETQKGNHNSPR